MIVLSTSAAQTIQAGASATFDLVVFKSGCGEFRNAGTGPVRIKCGVYSVRFNGNVGGAADTQPNLAIAVDGAAMPGTAMTATLALSTDVFNVGAETLVKNCCSGASVSVVNTGTTPVVLAENAALIVERVG